MAVDGSTPENLPGSAAPEGPTPEAADPRTREGPGPGVPEPDTSEPARARPVRRWLKRAFWAACGVLALFALWTWLSWPDVEKLATANPETTAFIERARRGGAEVSWIWKPSREISTEVKLAVLVAEDIGFFSHHGFEWYEVRVAIEDRLEEGRPLRGGSTITQQLAKNLWLSQSRSPLRKLKEALLARQLEAHLDKGRILEIYLNAVELGDGVFGVEAASRRYFGTSAARLGPHRAALLAAALPSPRSTNPERRTRGYESRVRRIEGRAVRAAWLRDLL